MKFIAAAALAIVALSAVAHDPGFAQEPTTIQALGHLSRNYRESIARRVSDDGSVVVGTTSTDFNQPHGFRWTAEDGMQDLAPFEVSRRSEAYGVSADGRVVVGLVEDSNRKQMAVRWDDAGTVRADYVPLGFYESAAFGVSGDGFVAVGVGEPSVTSSDHPFRFASGVAPYDLGTFGGVSGNGYATDASFDGGTIVGQTDRDNRPFRWTTDGGLQPIGKERGIAFGVSKDGNVVVGSTFYDVDRAFRWNGGVLEMLPVFEGFTGKSLARDVAEVGGLIVGEGEMPPGRSFSSRGQACVWRNGEIRSLWDLLEREYPTDLTGWTELRSVEGISADGTTLVGHGIYRGDNMAFRVVLRNVAPRIEPVAPVTVECDGGINRVRLSTAVSDNGNRVTIRWKVDGKTIQVQENVLPGVTTFKYDFPHGQFAVAVEATDGEFTTVAGTTVQVSDTTAPTLIVAPDLVVPADRRRDSATNVTLAPPQVYDACDGDPELIHNAPAQFPVGVTAVRWTAIDADGNRATAKQRVIVEDRESPRLSATQDVEAYCDWGRVFATLRLVPPEAVDNVTDEVVVKSSAGSRFGIGRTRVTWTATDEAGNTATKSMIVNVVNRTPRARPGKTVRIEAKSESGARIRLDGTASSDPDGHALRYSWRAPGVAFANPDSPKPLGTFPVGTTLARLKVTDEVGAERSASVLVVVTLANSEERPRGAQANRAFDAAAGSAHRAAAVGSADATRFLGLSHAAEAQRLGVLAGERTPWDEGGSSREALLEYAAIRAEQRSHGASAAKAWLQAYAEDGDEAALAAAIDALQGAAYAQADLSGR